MKPSRTSPVPFFLISLGFHLVLFFPWSNAPEIEKIREPIPVAFLPFADVKKVEPLREVEQQKPAVRPARTKAQTQQLARKPDRLGETPRPLPEVKIRRPEEPKVRPFPAGKRESIVRQSLPALKELLPPISWSLSPDGESIEGGAIRLDSQEPRYVTYLSSIKRAIELAWEYPDRALRHGLQGKLVLEFTILGNGTLMRTRLIRSSGFSILDEEAIRSVQAAAPFHPIPPVIGKNRLPIIASFEYLDNRLKYSFAP